MGNKSKATNKFFGENTQKMVETLSRTAVENYNENTVLYLEIDYGKSKRNFYGEFEIIKFVHEKGIEVKGIVNIINSETEEVSKLFNQNTLIEFSCYVSHLKELKIQPDFGNYFAYKNKFYYIYGRTALDASQSVIANGREPIWIKYNGYQEDDEAIYSEPWRMQSTFGDENSIY